MATDFCVSRVSVNVKRCAGTYSARACKAEGHFKSVYIFCVTTNSGRKPHEIDVSKSRPDVDFSLLKKETAQKLHFTDVDQVLC